jgi:bifunctional non-homologous end joining protein LigD
VTDRLSTYRAKRDRRRTPEPVPATTADRPRGNDDTFVVQEHHARRLHWDFRLERGGVLVSWALPKGLPDDPARNHLAVPTEDHPLEYATFAGEIPPGQYGGGSVSIWDSGTYACEKWSQREVKVVLHGRRVQGRYVLFRAGGDNWMIHRMDPPSDPDAEPLPELVPPMSATPGRLPRPEEEDAWAFEMQWEGERVVAYADRGSLRLLTGDDADVTATYPELRRLADALGEHRAVLDGTVVAFDEQGRPSSAALLRRAGVQRPTPSLRAQAPVTYLLFDVLHLDGHPTVGRRYLERRALLDGLRLAGGHWQVPPHFEGSGAEALRVARQRGLAGVVAKRGSSPYRPGARSRDWVLVTGVRVQDVVVGGWTEGAGGGIGSVLVGVHDPDAGELRYVGSVRTGFARAGTDDLVRRLRRLERRTSPFPDVPRTDDATAHWVTPRLVGEVTFTDWTGDARLRHPSWRRLRVHGDAAEVFREP